MRFAELYQDWMIFPASVWISGIFLSIWTVRIFLRAFTLSYSIWVLLLIKDFFSFIQSFTMFVRFSLRWSKASRVS